MTIDYPGILREIGRGKHAARALSRAQAEALGRALGAGEVPDGVVGALLIALRMKGESVDELIGLQTGLCAAQPTLTLPHGAHCSALVIASYNGARRTPNLLPLLALILREAGVPVLIHGPREVPGRTSTCAILERLGHGPCVDAATVAQTLSVQGLAYVPIEVLAPAHARLLAWRATLGVRNVAHTLVKLLDPFATPALRVIGITHPAYRDLLLDYLATTRGNAVLLRGHEGEAVAGLQRLPAMHWVVEGIQQSVAELAEPLACPEPSALPDLGPAETADWTARVLAAGSGLPLPAALLEQAARLLWMTGYAVDLAAARAWIHARFERRISR